MITNRNWAAIMQYAEINKLEHRFEQALEALKGLLPLVGPQSQSRAMINRIGITLLQEEVRIVAPSCPDYSHRHGKYDFTTVGAGIPLLSQVHIQFLETIAHVIPHAHYEIVVADQEAKDDALSRKIGHSHESFLELIHKSIRATQNYVRSKGWTVTAMTTRFPELTSLEVTTAEQIANDRQLQDRINSDTRARSLMYQKIGVHDFAAMRQRTIRTAAQYSALAQIAARDNLLVCNHETVNLGWYNRYNAAVLHNPVSVY